MSEETNKYDIRPEETEFEQDANTLYQSETGKGMTIIACDFSMRRPGFAM